MARKRSAKAELLSDKEYYFLGFFGEPDGSNYASVQSRWVGFESVQPLVEIRRACTVDAPRLALHFAEQSFPIPVVNTLDAAATLLGYGGYAFVEKSIAEDIFSSCLGSEPVIPHGALGFEGKTQKHSEFERRAPSKKLRMKVLKRDGLRCKICGRSAESSSDIELHVHHIRPLGERGGTAESNLITLCQTCHGGLDPHFDLSLFALIGVKGEFLSEDWRKDLLLKQIQYRKNFLRLFGK